MNKETISKVMSELGKRSAQSLTKEQRIERARKAGKAKRCKHKFELKKQTTVMLTNHNFYKCKHCKKTKEVLEIPGGDKIKI